MFPTGRRQGNTAGSQPTVTGIAEDMADWLRAAITDLDGYIERRAAELTAPLIASAAAEAGTKAARAERELRTQQDLADELKTRLALRDRQLEQWRTATGARHPHEIQPAPRPD
jgi:hypothetical protein